MQEANANEQKYVMAFSSEEVRRLQLMAKLLVPATEQFLKRAGVQQGS